MQIALTDGFSTHPAVMAAGNAAVGLYLRLATWAVRYDNRGWTIPTALARSYGSAVNIRRLLSSGLAEPTADGYRLNTDLFTVRRDEPRAPIPDTIRAAVLERDGHRCVECGATGDLTLDHIYPWSLGGPDTPENLRVLCRPCNSRKGAKV